MRPLETARISRAKVPMTATTTVATNTGLSYNVASRTAITSPKVTTTFKNQEPTTTPAMVVAPEFVVSIIATIVVPQNTRVKAAPMSAPHTPGISATNQPIAAPKTATTTVRVTAQRRAWRKITRIAAPASSGRGSNPVGTGVSSLIFCLFFGSNPHGNRALQQGT